jgi:hypothetical protein
MSLQFAQKDSQWFGSLIDREPLRVCASICEAVRGETESEEEETRRSRAALRWSGRCRKLNDSDHRSRPRAGYHRRRAHPVVLRLCHCCEAASRHRQLGRRESLTRLRSTRFLLFVEVLSVKVSPPYSVSRTRHAVSSTSWHALALPLPTSVAMPLMRKPLHNFSCRSPTARTRAV